MDHKIGATPKSVNELHRAIGAELSALSCVCDAVPKLLRVLGRNRWSFKWLRLAFQDDDRRLADMESQFIGSIGMKQMKEIVHRNYQHELMETNLRTSIKHYSRFKKTQGQGEGINEYRLGSQLSTDAALRLQ